MEAFEKRFGGSEIGKGFAQLNGFNKGYNELLDAAIKGGVNETIYNSEIAGLFTKPPVAIEWLMLIEREVVPELADSDN